jgi:hypothetical protein
MIGAYLLLVFATTLALLAALPELPGDRVFFLATSAVGLVGLSHDPIAYEARPNYILALRCCSDGRCRWSCCGGRCGRRTMRTSPSRRRRRRSLPRVIGGTPARVSPKTAISSRETADQLDKVRVRICERGAPNCEMGRGNLLNGAGHLAKTRVILKVRRFI